MGLCPSVDTSLYRSVQAWTLGCGPATKPTLTEAEIDTEVYVKPPEGFVSYDEFGRPKVLKLRKALYGTKQASRLWQLHLRQRLIDMGFSNSKTDPCLYSYRSERGVCIVGVYVDDIVCAWKGDTMLEWFTRELSRSFRTKHLGRLSWYLGMEIDQHDDFTITLKQTQYVKKMIDRYVPGHKTNSISHSLPCNPDTFIKLDHASSDEEREKMSTLPYRQLIGSLLYISTMTRPDIAYYMTVLCKFMQDPSMDCYIAAIGLLLYVHHTQHKFICYDGTTSPHSGLGKYDSHISNNKGFVAYSDASWRDPHKFGWNMFGYVCYMYGGPVAFAAKLLKVVALSTAEAEYAAASYTCREVQFIRNVCADLGCMLRGELIMCVDNTAAIDIARNMGVTARTKHFTDAIHYFRDLVDRKCMLPVHVSTDRQRADGFTKPLPRHTFLDWVDTLVH